MNDQQRGPRFLGIGAPRSGTTWLHSALARHPALWLPPIKEVHYFDSIDDDIESRFDVSGWSARMRKHLIRRLGHYAAGLVLSPGNPKRASARPDLQWDLAYFRPGSGLDWYRGLFERRGDLVAGEITPAYFALGESTIEMIVNELGVRKFIVLLRDPFDSVVSGLGKRIRDGEFGALTPRDDAELSRNILGNGFDRRLYGRNLQRWFANAPRSDFFIGFYDELEQDPTALLDRICEFLEVAPLTDASRKSSSARVNSSSSSQIQLSAAVSRVIFAALAPDLDLLAKILPNPRTEQWRDRCRAGAQG